MRQNLFIALEGIDGSGKSTQVKLLTERLTNAGHKIYTTFEPTDGPIGVMLRSIFSGKQEADHRTIAALFAADRLEHLLNKTNGLLKMLNEGYTVICDRYYFSSYAYHSVHMPLDWVIETNRLAAELLRPDLNIYIDISPEVSMERLNKGRSNLEIYETLDNLTSVRNKYLEAFNLLKDKERMVSISGNREAGEIAVDIWGAVQYVLKSSR